VTERETTICSVGGEPIAKAVVLLLRDNMVQPKFTFDSKHEPTRDRAGGLVRIYSPKGSAGGVCNVLV